MGWPELLLRRDDVLASCDEEDSESELDELLSDPLELPLDEDDPELEPELDSDEVVDCTRTGNKHIHVINKGKHKLSYFLNSSYYLFPRRHNSKGLTIAGPCATPGAICTIEYAIGKVIYLVYFKFSVY